MIKSDGQGGIMITTNIETKLLVSVLTIRKSKMTDSGEYFCQSSDQDIGKITVNVMNGRRIYGKISVNVMNRRRIVSRLLSMNER